jgi:hypothetical protein
MLTADMTSLDTLRAAFPREGLFADKEWLLSPEPFPLKAKTAREISALGHRLRVFYRGCNALYQRSVKGRLPRWVAGYCDAGKPAQLLEGARARPLRTAIPRVIRPDVLLTDHGLAITELDSVPGGIGLTAWLNRVYHRHSGLIGGAHGMIDGFASILPRGADILVSEESASYRPEMEWLAEQLNAASAMRRPDNGGSGYYRVCGAAGYQPEFGRDVYRFFELFDLPNLSGSSRLLGDVAGGRLQMTPPPKPWLEEKLWMALFRLRPLRDVWRRELSDNQFRRLDGLFPYSWILDPTPLPHHAVIPKLGIQKWNELTSFTQKERELVLKISGFHEQAWGARSVVVGHDVSHRAWAAAVGQALARFPAHPHVLQTFHRAKVIEHPYFDRDTGALRTMRGRVRLCPYYFIAEENDTITLGGILATICPEDKKILHGMKDAILVPCRVVE